MVTPIPDTWATRIRTSFPVPSRRSRSFLFVLALVLTGILLATSLSAFAGSPSAGDSFLGSSASASVAGRVATPWPLSPDRLWDPAIRGEARYVPPHIQKPPAS